MVTITDSAKEYMRHVSHGQYVTLGVKAADALDSNMFGAYQRKRQMRESCGQNLLTTFFFWTRLRKCISLAQR